MFVFSSLSDHPMAATAAYGKVGEYAHFGGRQIPTKRSVSASQPPTSAANALRLQQRRLHEQENIDQLLQKCRTSQRGLACNAQLVEWIIYSMWCQYGAARLSFVYPISSVGNVAQMPRARSRTNQECHPIKNLIGILFELMPF
ncbi:unnamed protein product [Toxocara canis]|uniref:Uncharacterized protein n=1 Tax=Toxocara canis TaxID=6265 RepID=A0A183VAQ5_TOXCA|nr:unnamed protein product [Toxocara canis]